MPLPQDKPFAIPKLMVWEAWRQVKANRGAPGVDGEDLEAFEADLEGNLYKIWNRMSSGTYFPPPVRAVEIPKPHSPGTRMLGVPTIADRVAQTVAADYLEPLVEPIFHPDSYGYRPGKSAHDALEACRRRCWEYDWLIDLDIQKFFDTVPWNLIVRAVEAVTDCRWVLLYVKRWLQAPLQLPDGTNKSETREPRRDRRSRPSWRTCSCTMRSIRGWPEISRAARLSATPTTPSCTAARGGRRNVCWPGSLSG
jgi:group II intron reverse transcriptase/maturase